MTAADLCAWLDWSAKMHWHPLKTQREGIEGIVLRVWNRSNSPLVINRCLERHHMSSVGCNVYHNARDDPKVI